MREDVVTPREIADDLNVSDRTVRSWLERGVIHGTNLTGRWRIKRSDYDRFRAQFLGSVACAA